MRFTYCPDCGARLSDRELGDEGLVPWCDRCNKPWFDMFPTAVISLVYDDRGQVLLLRQNYISTEWSNLISGYIQPGENAETTARREILEETGLEVDNLQLRLTRWFPKKQMLMIGFFAHALPGQQLRLSSEVDSAAWTPAESALDLLSPSPTSAARALLISYLG
ncbi:MAG: NUDIX domain-containing protein [Muribaculaceae bacterium]|nr:NUDIX domain-containing protein [Muribaculaceae bacterium]